MKYMSDAEYEFVTDVKNKKSIARGAGKKKSHSSKSRKCTLPSDKYTKKQLNSLNGKVKTYRLGEPMTWHEFTVMPDDLQRMYIKELRKKFNVPDEELANDFGIKHNTFSKHISNLGLCSRKASTLDSNWYETEDHEKFTAWWIIAKEAK